MYNLFNYYKSNLAFEYLAYKNKLEFCWVVSLRPCSIQYIAFPPSGGRYKDDEKGGYSFWFSSHLIFTVLVGTMIKEKLHINTKHLNSNIPMTKRIRIMRVKCSNILT